MQASPTACLGRVAAEVHVAFEEAKAAFPAGKALLTGNPVRGSRTGGDRAEALATFGVPDGVPVLVVTGGSLGAQRLNEAILAQLPAMLGDRAHAVWITGPRYYERTRLALGGVARPASGSTSSPTSTGWSSPTLRPTCSCAAPGAITLAELALTGTPSVLVPSPNVAEDHQTHNARAFERAAAAVLLPEADLDAQPRRHRAPPAPTPRPPRRDGPGRRNARPPERRRPTSRATCSRSPPDPLCTGARLPPTAAHRPSPPPRLS